ncbi:MAG: carboxypeptidase regulatory-like domain-containing protein, partial [Planctomycetes bacterium]|nr:carboxypeptidase regulatory-like domain-containing protein [Planctomycetota bacterium]
DGSFTIRGVPEGKYEVNIEKDDDGDGASELKIHQKDIEVTKDNGRHLGQVKLKRAGSISGKALIDKNPVGNIGVTVFVPGTSFLAITDDSGAYTISFLAEGSYKVAALKSGHTTATVENVAVEAGKDAPGIDFALTKETGAPKGNLTGIAKRADSADHSKISVKASGATVVSETDAAGAFTVSGVPAGIATLEVSAKGYAPQTAPNLFVVADKTTALSITIFLSALSAPDFDGDGAPNDQDTDDDNDGFPDTDETAAGSDPLNAGSVPTGTLSGTALLEGQPTHQNIVVTVAGLGAFAVTDAAGAYRFEGLRAGTYTLSYRREGFADEVVSGVAVLAGKTTTRDPVMLASTQKFGVITGVVTLYGKSDHSGVTVEIDGGGAKTSTDGTGKYTLSNVPQGLYRLKFTKSGYVEQVVNNVFSVPGGAYIVPDVTLVLPGTTPTPQPGGDVTPPSGTVLTIGAVTSDSISLSWTPATDAVTPASALVYRLYAETSDFTTTVGRRPAITTTAGATTAVLAGLTASTTYYVAALAVDQVGNEERIGTQNKQSSATPLSIDVIPPEPPLISPIESPRRERNLVIGGTASTDTTGVSVKLNGTALTPVVLENGSWHVAASLADGPNTIAATSADSAGNPSSPAVLVVTYDPWTLVSGTPWAARNGHVSVVFDGKLWVMGGVYQHDVWSSVDGVSWTEVTPNAPWVGRQEFAVSVLSGKMWIQGGRTASGGLSDLWWSTDGKQWVQQQAPTWGSRNDHAMVTFNGKLWVLAGSNRSDVWSSVSGTAWAQETSSAAFGPRGGFGCVEFNNRIVVLAGAGPNGLLSDIWSSTDGREWTLENPSVPWAPRWNFAAVVKEGTLFVLGGSDLGTTLYNDVWSTTDLKNWQRETATAEWLPRGGHTAVTLGSRIILVGGGKPQSGITHADVWESTDSKSWSPVAPGTPWVGRGFVGAAVLGEKLHVIGGDTGFGDRGDRWSSTDGANWTRVAPDSPWGNRGALRVLEHGRALFAMGGVSTANGVVTRHNDVWSSADGSVFSLVTPAAQWSGRQDFATVSHDSRIWVVGGFSTRYLNDVWSSGDGANWTQVTSDAPWLSRRNPTLVSFSGKIFLLGGYSSANNREEFFRDVWSTSDGRSWTQVVQFAPWDARDGHTSTVLGNRIWVVGGLGGGGRDLADVWSSSDGVSWTKSGAEVPWVPRHGHALIARGDGFWILGGLAGVYMNDVWLYR